MSEKITNIVFVKKILANGEPCRKCEQVLARLHEDQLFDSLDQIIIANESNPDSEGMRLATEHEVNRAPFFIVEYDSGRKDVYDIYLKFRKVIAASAEAVEEKTEDLIDLLEQYPELDYI